MLSQVNISGLRAATDENRQVGRRLVWVFLLVVCFAVMVAQITDRVRHFLSEPVSVQVSVARNLSLQFPAVTVCNKNIFNMSAVAALIMLRNQSEWRNDNSSASIKDSRPSSLDLMSGAKSDIAVLLEISHLDAHSLWIKTAQRRNVIISECWFGRNVTCDTRGTWTMAFTTMGICYTYKLNDSMAHLAGIFHNLYLKLEETEEIHYAKDHGWKVYIHDEREKPTLGVHTHGTSLYSNQGRDLRLDMKKLQALHHSKNRCDTDPSYFQNNCYVECFMKRLASGNLTCRLPYMTESYFENLPFCSTPDSYRNTEKVANDLFFYGLWSPNHCFCKQQCLKFIFIPSLESTTDNYKVRSKKNVARVRVYYQSLEFEYIREEVGYGTIDLLCDVGGTLSLLMGASLLTCCELFEVAWIYMVEKLHTYFTSSPANSDTREMQFPVDLEGNSKGFPSNIQAGSGIFRTPTDHNSLTNGCQCKQSGENHYETEITVSELNGDKRIQGNSSEKPLNAERAETAVLSRYYHRLTVDSVNSRFPLKQMVLQTSNEVCLSKALTGLPERGRDTFVPFKPKKSGDLCSEHSVKNTIHVNYPHPCAFDVHHIDANCQQRKQEASRKTIDGLIVNKSQTFVEEGTSLLERQTLKAANKRALERRRWLSLGAEELIV